MSAKYATFLNESEKLWLIKVFVAPASRESLALTLTYF